jgi:hypothetical protein
MRLWNFKTTQYDEVTTITDANASNYMPENKILENRYAMLRDQGEQPIQALSAILASHQVWN